MSFRKMRIMLLRLAFLPIVLMGLFVWRSWSDESVTDYVVEWSGYLLLLAGLGIRIWSTLYIGSRKSKEIITDGPYSLCRNPLYLGTFAITIGASLCLENLAMLLAALLVMVPVHVGVILAEEKHLAGLFGQPYEEYLRRVPRFLVSLKNYRSPATVEVSTRAIRRVTIEAMGILLIPPIGDLIELLHARGILPALFQFP
ncbi:MAG TPA: hypothetical protein DCX07_03800 [Phycisphaerales bacterium]|nr:hypothetical protein [Phycisphaerales bacterium]